MIRSIRSFLMASLLALSLLVGQVSPVRAASLPAEINKQFTPLQIDAGAVSVMRVTIFNPNIFELTNASWTDNLVGVQPGLYIANPAGIVNTCGSVLDVTAMPGTTNLALSNGTVPPQSGSTPGECYVEVNVSSVTPGNLINTIPAGNLSSQGDDGGTTVNITNTTPASATITVTQVLNPSLSKLFVPSTIFVGENSQLTIRLNNNDSDTNLTGASYTDTLPAGLQIATPNGLTVTNCGPGTATALAGGTVISLSGATVTPAQDCLVRVNVTGASGAYLIANSTANTIPAGPGGPGSLQTNQGVTNTTPAQGEITIQPISVQKAFAPDPVDAGDTSILTITLENPTGAAYTGVAINDDLTTMGAGFTIGGVPTANTCGFTVNAPVAGTLIQLTSGTIPASVTPPTPRGTCIFSIPVQTSLTSTGGTSSNNTIPANTLTATQPVTNFLPATDNLTVNRALVGTKAYSPTSMLLGGTSQVTITLTNRSNTPITGVTFTDTLAANLTVSGTPLTPQCGGAISNAANSVTLTGGTIPANANCTIVFDVTSNTVGTYDNTVGANTINNDQGIGHASFNTNPDLVVINAATLPVGLTKAFQTDPIALGQPTRLRITITAPVDTNLTGLDITDNLPAGLVIVGTASTPSAPANPTDTCTGANVVAPINGTSISLTGASILAGGNCTITVYVTATTPGLYTNTIPTGVGGITTIEGRTNINPATDTLTATGMTTSKAFYPDYVQAGGRSTVTLTLFNTSSIPMTNISVTDTMPGTATNGVRVAAVPNAITTCGGTLTAAPGSNIVTLTGGTIPAGSIATPSLCTITFDVVGLDSTPGTSSTQTNTLPAVDVDAFIGSTGVATNPVADSSATLNIQDLSMGVVKGFNPVLVYGGAYSTMSVELINPNLNAPLTGIAFTDDMTLLGTGMRLANPVTFDVGTCGGVLTGNPGDTSFSFSGGSLAPTTTCTLTLRVVMTVNGNLTNRIPAGTVTTFNGVSNPDPTEASLTNLPGVSVSKSFSPAQVLTNQPSTLTIIISNTSNVPVVNMGVADNLPGTLPDGLEVANPANETNTCGGTLTAVPGAQTIQLVGGGLTAVGTPGAICTLTVDVISTRPGVYVNTIPAGAITSTGGVTNNDPTTDTLTVTTNYSLGNRVWYDTNNNGLIDFGTEAGIPNVRVQLFNAAGTEINVGPDGILGNGDDAPGGMLTNATGYYRFDNLPAGDYTVRIPNDNFTVGGTTDALVGYWSSGTTVDGSGVPSDATTNDPDTDVDDSDENGLTTLSGNVTNFVASATVTLGPGSVEPLNESDLSGGQGATDGYANMTVDFGFYRQTLGDLVFVDVDGSGAFNAGDTLLQNALVQLYSSNGTEIITGADGIRGTADDGFGPDGISGNGDDGTGGVTTGAGGTYSFSGLPQGDYIVRVTPPAGYSSTVDTAAPADTTDPDTNTDNNDNGSGAGTGQVSSGVVTLTPGQGTGGSAGAANNVVTQSSGTTSDPTVDFGFITPGYSLGNRVWFDTDNSSTINGTEVGIDGVRVNLYLDDGTTPGVYDAGDTFVDFDTTATGGYYRFDNLTANDYVVVIPADNFRNVGFGDTVAGDPLSGYFSSGSTISVAGAVSDSTANDPDTTATDSDENGISTLTGNTINYVASSAVTLGPGASEPSGETDLSGGQGATDLRANMTVDFGFYRTEIGNLVFSDVNGDGDYDAGIDGLISGAQVQLYSSNGTEINVGLDGILGTSDDAAGGVTTGVTGTYLFSGLPQGDYIVRVTPPAGTTSTVDTAAPADTTDPDTNTDNNDNGSGTGAGQVSSGILTMTPGQGTGGSVGAANNVVTNGTGSTTDPTVDFGFTPLYSLGNRVWYDTNNNGSIDFGTESGINGVQVNLYLDNGTTPGVYDAGDTFVVSDITASGGYYRFDSLNAGNYVITIPADNFRNVGVGDTVAGDPLAGYWSSGSTISAAGVISDSTSNDPDTTVTDSDENGISTLTGNSTNYVASAAVTLGPGGSEPTGETDLSGGQGAGDTYANMTVDFGFYRQTLGDLVFVDNNTNGTYDAGDTLLQNAVVQLYSSNGTEINVGPDGILGTSDDAPGGVTTGAGGTYQFSGLPQGDYIVRVTPPVGYSSTVDTANAADTTDPDTNTNNNDNGAGTGVGQVSSNPVTLTPGSVGALSNNTVNNNTGVTTNPTVDFGFVGNNGAVTKTMTGTNETFTTDPDVAIGEIVTYQVVVNLPVGTPLTNVTVTDQMDKGLAFVDCVLVEVAGVNQTATVCPPAVSSITNPGDLPGNPANPGRQIVFTLGNIAAQPAAATIRIQYRAIVLDVVENQQGVTLNNSVTWAFTGGSFTASAPDVNIIEPDLSIDKSATPNAGVAIGTPIQFSLTINHTTFSSVDAFDVVVTDILPPELEYIPCSITYTGLAPTTPVAPAYCPGATSNLIFEWDVFPLGATATITFNARLVNTPAANTANVAWTSLPIDPGPGGAPVQLSTHNTESTERWYDPLDDVNIYAVFDTVTINAATTGGGTTDDDEDSSLPNTLPKTGFAPNRITRLPAQPAEKEYNATEVWLEVPRLGLTMPIVGVPIVEEDWDVSWLWNEAGWLEGTAFPGWEGNSVLTSHVTLSNGAAGPFAQLGNLKYGDRIIVHAYGSLYIYEVRQNRTISPYNTTVLQHEDDAWITLLTCKTYNEDTETYSNRIAVRAVLIRVTEDKTNSGSSNIR
ncbi:MAG: sortase [Anaerolineae bacterium]|nr:sortase [Anaerolineae bacterium]